YKHLVEILRMISLVNLGVQLNLTIELNRFTFITIFEANKRPEPEEKRRCEQASN
ncbi:unnamed protein product, partial [Heterotrigona itama]